MFNSIIPHYPIKWEVFLRKILKNYLSVKAAYSSILVEPHMELVKLLLLMLLRDSFLCGMGGVIHSEKVVTVLIHANAFFFCVNGKRPVEAFWHP